MRSRLAITLLLLLLTARQAAADVVLIMRRSAEPAGNYVRVCDVARVEGPAEQAREVGLTVLAPAPGRGEELEITRWDIESRLYEMGIAERVVFTGNDQVRVVGSGSARARAQYEEDEGGYSALLPVGPVGGIGSDAAAGRQQPSAGQRGDAATARAGAGNRLDKPAARVYDATEALPPMEATTDDAKKRVALAVSHYLAGQYKRPDVEVEATLLSLSADVPYSAQDVSVAEAVSGRVPGKATLLLRVTDEAGSRPREVTASVDATVYAQAPVAARQLYKGDVLTKQDILMARVKMESGKSYLPPNAKAVDGRELKRNVRAGEAILAADAVPGAAVRRGDLVVVDTSGRGWQVQTVAKAAAGGMVGDMITVEDATTKARYPARITGRGVVTAITRTGLNRKKDLP